MSINQAYDRLYSDKVSKLIFGSISNFARSLLAETLKALGRQKSF